MERTGWRVLVPSWFLAWFARPQAQTQQTSSGRGAVHVGEATGGVDVDNSKHTITMVVNQTIYAAQTTPAADAQPAQATTLTVAQREVLMLITRLPQRGEAVLKFMDREFKTRMVMDLKPSELMRVRAYVAKINTRLAGKPTEGKSCRESA